MELLIISLLGGLSYGLLLFLLCSGLTLIFSLMGVLNFAHASFYMLGAYVAYALAGALGFWLALLLAPLLVGLAGAAFERYGLRQVHAMGHVPELLMTFGLAYVALELVQLLWGRAPLDFHPPAALRGAAFTLVAHPADGLGLHWGNAPAGLCGQAVAGDVVRCTPFAAMRAFTGLTALLVLGGLWGLLARTRIGLTIQAALTHPETVQTLGHDVPRIFMLVFGVGAALAALAGVLGGSALVTEPGMALAVGTIIFVVVVVGGLGSLAGAFWASLLIGVLQTAAVTADASLLDAWRALGLPPPAGAWAQAGWLRMGSAQVAPILPYALLVLVLVLRPRGLLGQRAG